MTPPVFDGSSISGDIAVMRDGILLGLPHFLTWHGSKITILPYSNGNHDGGFGEPRRETHSLSILFHLFNGTSILIFRSYVFLPCFQAISGG